jgi:hypothetical protein
MTGSETSAGPVVGPEQALEFVASASALLARSLDYETTLREVARLAVPDVADWCGVLLVDSGEGERELSSGYEDPALEAVLGIRTSAGSPTPTLKPGGDGRLRAREFLTGVGARGPGDRG